MKQTSTVMGQDDIAKLKQIIGSQWLSLNGNQMDYDNLSWDWVVIESSSKSIQVSNKIIFIENAIEPDEYSFFSITDFDRDKSINSKSSSSYFQGKGETISEIWIVHDNIRGFENKSQLFQLEIDRAIVFKLDNSWISLSKDALWSEAISIDRGASREELDLRNLEDEWPSDLLETYEFKREWVKL